MRQTLTDDFWGLHKNMNCAFPLKSKTYKHEISYKNNRKLSESIKQRAKSQYYSKMILHYKVNIKKLGKL